MVITPIKLAFMSIICNLLFQHLVVGKFIQPSQRKRRDNNSSDLESSKPLKVCPTGLGIPVIGKRMRMEPCPEPDQVCHVSKLRAYVFISSFDMTAGACTSYDICQETTCAVVERELVSQMPTAAMVSCSIECDGIPQTTTTLGPGVSPTPVTTICLQGTEFKAMSLRLKRRRCDSNSQICALYKMSGTHKGKTVEILVGECTKEKLCKQQNCGYAQTKLESQRDGVTVTTCTLQCYEPSATTPSFKTTEPTPASTQPTGPIDSATLTDSTILRTELTTLKDIKILPDTTKSVVLTTLSDINSFRDSSTLKDSTTLSDLNRLPGSTILLDPTPFSSSMEIESAILSAATAVAKVTTMMNATANEISRKIYNEKTANINKQKKPTKTITVSPETNKIFIRKTTEEAVIKKKKKATIKPTTIISVKTTTGTGIKTAVSLPVFVVVLATTVLLV